MTARAALAISPPPAAAPRAVLWTAFALALAALLLPDCCLAGRHSAGFDMEAFAPICHAAR
jgi:hypothetical protein